MSGKITILGCGASAGVPLIGCECAVCQSDNLRNKRTRASILIENNGSSLLVDASPDLRRHALKHRFKSIDALFITHSHADHCHGIDDIRSFNFHKNAAIPLYADAQTHSELRQRFGYIYQPPSPNGWFRAAVEAREITPNMAVKTGAIEWTPFMQMHGAHQLTYGVRVGNVAYSTDVKAFPEGSEPCLLGLDVWIIDCLRYAEAPTHAHLDLTLEWIEKYQPKRAILTHMSHDFDYEGLRNQLPPIVEPAYDGMVLGL
jgi:phosphoribosyl 1,2-cyclic phosphate phosphodiesterase